MIRLKPVSFVHRPSLPEGVTPLPFVLSATAPKEVVMARSYKQLVTSQGVHPERAKELLGLAK
jgi:hypothetical protein